MRLLDSRRLTGPHLLLDRPGAAAEIEVEPGDDLDALRRQLIDAAAALGWVRPTVVTRRWTGGVSVAFVTPVDQLETGAWLFDHLLTGTPAWDELVAIAERERNPALAALAADLDARGQAWFWDEDGVTVGLGAHSATWALDALPALGTATGRAIPVVLVTGTNGKTTTTRLIARIAREAGHVVGHTSSDGVVVDGAVVSRGDWTGPGAARQVLRDPRVTFAVLETARGGLMRRGLVMGGADAAVVTNVSDDHLGEWGIEDLRAIAEAKLVVARGLRPGGALIVNAEVPVLAAAAASRSPRWFGVAPAPDRVACVVDGWIVLRGEPLVAVADVPITFGGAARFNVENALAAVAAADAAGLPRAAIASGLTGFHPTPEDNAGRVNLLTVRGATAIVDFAHNPDGLRQLAPVVDGISCRTRAVLLGQAGDRRDEDLVGLVDAAVAIGFDRYHLKELPDHLRGRQPGEVPALLRRLLRSRGVPDEAIEVHDNELSGVRGMVERSEPGDLLLLLVHEQYAETIQILRGL